MGVYYHCAKCDSTLHLTPQSVGFGKLRIACVVCDGEAMYIPSGPAPGAKVIQVPAKGQSDVAVGGGAQPPAPAQPSKRGSRLSLSAMISSSPESSGPNLTVPLQTPQALLDMDAAEAAPTLPVTGVSDEQIKIFKGGAASSGARAQSAGKSLRGKGGSGKDFIDATTPMESPVNLLNAAYERAVGRGSGSPNKANSTVEQPGLEAEIIQRATANAAPSLSALTDLPHDLRHIGPESSDEALTMHIERPTPAPVRRLEPVPEPQAASVRQGPDEDKIPTRSLEGLADREIRGYARELYTDEEALEVSAVEPQTLPPIDKAPSYDEGALEPSFDEASLRAADTSVAPMGGPQLGALSMPGGSDAGADGFSMGDLSSSRADGPGGGVGGVPAIATSSEPDLGGEGFVMSSRPQRAEPAWGRQAQADEPSVGQSASTEGQESWSMHSQGPRAGSQVKAQGGPQLGPASSPSGAPGSHASGPATGFGAGVSLAPHASPSSPGDGAVNGSGPSLGLGPGQVAGDGPSMGGQGRAPELDGLGKDSFSDERPQAHARSRRRGLGLVVVIGAGFFCLVALVMAFFAYQVMVKHDPSPTTSVGAEGGQAPDEVAPSRAARFGFPPVDEEAPFEVEGVRFKLKGHKGDKVAILVEGTLFNKGENALDTATLNATVGVVSEEGQVLTHALEKATFEPRVTRRRAWQPGQSVSFELRASGVPRGDFTDPAADRFMWLTLEAKNGKSFSYKGTLVEVDIE